MNLNCEDEVVDSSIINKLSMGDLKLDLTDENGNRNTLKKILVYPRKQDREKSIFFEENGKTTNGKNFLTLGPSTSTDFYSHKDSN